jgi:hypothetical protein
MQNTPVRGPDGEETGIYRLDPVAAARACELLSKTLPEFAIARRSTRPSR